MPCKSAEGWVVIVTNVHEEAQEDDVYEHFADAAARVTAAPKMSVRSAKAQSRAFLGRTAPLQARVAAPRAVARGASVRADAATEDLNKKLKEVTSTVSEKWEETDDKPAVITLGIYGLVGLVAANGVLKSIDKIL